MTKLPRIRGAEAISALRKAGFEVLRVRGSHHILGNADGRIIVVPVHRGEDLGPGILRQILRDADLTVERFRDLL